MKVFEINPQAQEKVVFTFTEYLLIPKLSGCYLLTSFDDTILYIGQTKNLFNRFQQHLNNPQKTQPINKAKVAWFYYKIVAELDINKIERTWMNEYQRQHGILPPLNKIHSPLS